VSDSKRDNSPQDIEKLKKVLVDIRDSQKKVDGDMFRDEDIVYIGRKPVMSYVLAAVTQFNIGNSNKVVLKGRGRAISKAVDVSEIIRNKFIQELEIDDIKIGTEEVKREDGSTSNVSSIEIYLSAGGKEEFLAIRRITSDAIERINESPQATVEVLTGVLSSDYVERINLEELGSRIRNKQVSKLFSSFEGLIEGKEIFNNLKKAESSLSKLKNVRNGESLHEFLNLIQILGASQSIENIKSSKELITQVKRHAEVLDSRLVPILNEIIEISGIVSKYSKVSESGDQLYYINEGISLCEKTERSISGKLYRPYSNLLREILIQWRKIYSETLDDIRGAAKLSSILKSRNVVSSEETIALLSVKNEGATSASNVRVRILPSSDYSAIDKTKFIEIVPPGKEVPFEFRIEPLQKEKIRVEFQIQYDDLRKRDQKMDFADVIEFFEVREVFTKIDNPYIPGHPVKTKEMFFGREDVFRFVLENLRGEYQNNTIILHGQRRTGKTSILYQLLSGRLPNLYVPVFIDFQHLPDVNTGQFFYRVQTAILEELPESEIEAHRFELDDFEKYPYIRFDEFLGNLRKKLGERRNLVLLFDEFEVMENKVEKGLISDDIFGYFRSLIQHQDWIIIVFTGTHQLTEMTEKYWSVFFNIALHKKISFLNENEARDLITSPVAGRVEYDDLAIEKILRVTASHPYFIQLLCHSLVTYLNEMKARNYVTIADVNRVLEEVIEKGAATFSYVWERSTKAERVLLAVMASMIDEGRPRVMMEEVRKTIGAKKIRLEKEDLKEALRSLCERDILQSERVNPNYEFKVDLIRMWIAENKPLGTLIEEELS
jgi:DNA-binding protein Alba